jgi:charged multivesicular body protein 2A
MALKRLFDFRMTPDDVLQRNQKTLKDAMRDLDRGKARMEKEGKRIIADMKKGAKEGQMVCRHIHYKKLFTEDNRLVSFYTYLQWSKTRGFFIQFGL